MRIKTILAALTGALLFGAGAMAQAPSETRPKTPAVAPAPLPVTPAPTPSLNKTDVDGWLDGFMPYALSSGDVAGAVVVVVKDGQVLTEKGYGYADIKSRRKVDPKATLFRPGSVSKLFVWTAVMQQVEAGKIDLDKDINTYLDFKIPPYDGKPVTMRNLMTHTPGFAEWGKSLFVGSPQRLIPLGPLLARWTPKRIFEPGTTPAYSNYGASLAGYIVQRVSGESFDDYIEHHVFGPLGMQNSTFRQPLPAKYAANMATAYVQASLPPKPYELVAGEPAGSSSVTGDDMAHFMIAHLNNGQYNGYSLLKPATVVQMHAEGPRLNPPLDAMALGFYHEDRNGHSIIGHGGDTSYFHSDLALLDHDNIGLFISMNSVGKDAAVGKIRAALLHNFVDRYFPAPKPYLPTTSTAKAHAAQVAGLYRSSRRADGTMESVLNFISQVEVKDNKDGTITAGKKTWREIGPYLWTDTLTNESLLAFKMDGDKIVNFTFSDVPPVMVFQPVPGWAKISLIHPLFYAMLAIFIATLVLWPIQALVRRNYGGSFQLKGREALFYRLTRGVVALDLIAMGTWMMLISKLNNASADGSLDGMQRTAQVLTFLAAFGSLIAIWNAFLTVTGAGRGWWAKTSSVLIALACVAFVWLTYIVHFLSFDLFY